MGHGDELKAFLVNSTAIIDIVCVQETWLYSKKSSKKSSLATNFNINGYTSLFTNQGTTSRGGLAFFVRNNISHSPIVPNVTHPNIEASGITIHGRGQDLHIFNIYIHPGACQNSLVLEDFSKLTNNCNYNTIIVGDFNSKNIIWGSPVTCKKGKIIEDFMDLKKLICLNNGSPTFFTMATIPHPGWIFHWSLTIWYLSVNGRY